MTLSRCRWCPFAIATAVVLLNFVTVLAGDDRPSAPKVAYFPGPSAVQEKIEATLNQRTELNFADASLTDVMDFIKDLHQVQILIDERALQDQGIDPSKTINLEVSGITLRSALRVLLEREDLTYVVEDEVLKITTRAAIMRQQTRVYPVADLASSSEELKSLVEAVQNGVADAHWRTKEDSSIGGTVTAVLGTKALVIRQTYGGHEKVLELLSSLRYAQQSTATAAQPAK
jgi:type II secretory pathway component GspD/PulD (secretin)